MDEHETVERTPVLKRRNLRETLSNLMKRKTDEIPLPVVEDRPGKPSEKGLPPGFREIQSLPPEVDTIRSHMEQKITQVESGGVADEKDLDAAARTERIRLLQERKRTLFQERQYIPAKLETELFHLMEEDFDARREFGVREAKDFGRRFSGDPQKAGVVYFSESTSFTALAVDITGETRKEYVCPLAIGIWADSSGERRVAISVNPAERGKEHSRDLARTWYFYEQARADSVDSQSSPHLLRLHQLGVMGRGWFQEVKFGGASAAERGFQQRGLPSDIPYTIDAHLLETRLLDSMKKGGNRLSTSILRQTRGR